jgi:protein TonB
MAASSAYGINLEGAVPPLVVPHSSAIHSEPDLRLGTLEVSTAASTRSSRGPFGTAASILGHGALVAAVLVVPLLMDSSLPDPESGSVHAFFAQPLELAPPPPPPPPPPGGREGGPRVEAPPVARSDGFVAPVDTPELLPDDAGLDLGIEGGVSGGVEGGVPGGVVGGVIGGLPEAPPPAAAPVRVGGQIKEPKKIRDVAPAYPDAALQTGVQGVVILECLISPQGKVTDVKVLRGVPLLSEAAVEAARQWLYTPTLRDGVPVPVIMTVTVRFDLRQR